MGKIKITIEIDDGLPTIQAEDPCQGCPSKENWKWNGGCVGDCPRRMNMDVHWCGTEAPVPFEIEPLWPSGNSNYMATQEMWITRHDGTVVRQHPPAIRYG